MIRQGLRWWGLMVAGWWTWLSDMAERRAAALLRRWR